MKKNEGKSLQEVLIEERENKKEQNKTKKKKVTEKLNTEVISNQNDNSKEEILEVDTDSKNELKPSIDIDENLRFEHLVDEEGTLNDDEIVEENGESIDEHEYEELPEETEITIKDSVSELEKAEEAKQERNQKIKKWTARGIVAGLATLGIALAANSCSKSEESKKDSNEISTTSTSSITEEPETTTTVEVTTTEKPETAIITTDSNSVEVTIVEENRLEDFASIHYITKDEFINLLVCAQNEFEGTTIELEELCSFVYTINKSVINSELKELLVQTGVINNDDKLIRQNYLNTIDKLTNTMYYAKTYENMLQINEEIGNEFKNMGKSVHVSNMVSENSSEYEMYRLLDACYEKIGNAKTIEEAQEAYMIINDYEKSAYAINMPNNIEEEIYKDLYKEVYNNIVLTKFNVSVYDFVPANIDVESCEKTYTLR